MMEAELSMQRRLGAIEDAILITQGNIAHTYQKLGRREEAPVSLFRDSGENEGRRVVQRPRPEGGGGRDLPVCARRN